MSGICPCTLGNSVSKALFGLRDARKLNCDEPEQTGCGTVVSRNVRRTNSITSYQESPWLYLVTFRLENGEELTLQASEESYGALKEDTSWEITWREETLLTHTAK